MKSRIRIVTGNDRAFKLKQDRYRDGKHHRREDAKAVQGLGIRRTWSELLS